MHPLRWFQALDGIEASLSVVVGFVVFALGATWVGRRITQRLGVAASSPSLSAVTGVIGTLVSILIGLVIVSLWQSFQTARTAVFNEATQIRTCAQLAKLLGQHPEPFLNDLRTYVVALERDEWPAMAEGRGADTAAQALNVLTLDANRNRGPLLDLRSNIARLTELRAQRLSLTESGVNWLLWLAIFVTPMFSLTAIGLVNEPQAPFHYMLSLLAALAMSFAVFIAIELDLPFNGIASLVPDPITATLTDLDVKS
jgi:hypothetical protein